MSTKWSILVQIFLQTTTLSRQLLLWGMLTAQTDKLLSWQSVHKEDLQTLSNLLSSWCSREDWMKMITKESWNLSLRVMTAEEVCKSTQSIICKYLTTRRDSLNKDFNRFLLISLWSICLLSTMISQRNKCHFNS